MGEFVLTAASLKAGYAIAGVLFALYFSRWLDKRAGINFREMIQGIVAMPLAAALYFGLRFIAVCLLLGMLVSCSSPASAGSLFPDRYDGQIRSAVARYWPDMPDWLAWRAQLYQESRLRPEAVSPVGAAGLAQFMPGTWRDVSREMGLVGVSPHAEIAIEAGAYYMAKLRRGWTANRPSVERHRLAQASYNAGTGNILRAQTRCGGARDWPDIAPCLRTVTGPAHSAETIGYVVSIARWRGLMAAEAGRP